MAVKSKKKVILFVIIAFVSLAKNTKMGVPVALAKGTATKNRLTTVSARMNDIIAEYMYIVDGCQVENSGKGVRKIDPL